MPVNTNILIKNGVVHELEGIVVYAPITGKVYIPTEALSLINGTIIDGIKRAAEAA
jgi:alkaline phosphatase